jgi:hypothetical protein
MSKKMAHCSLSDEAATVTKPGWVAERKASEKKNG